MVERISCLIGVPFARRSTASGCAALPHMNRSGRFQIKRFQIHAATLFQWIPIFPEFRLEAPVFREEREIP